MQTKEQKRSEFALKKITSEFNDLVNKETANFMVGMPTMILTNGIGQSLAFLLSKKSDDRHAKTFKILKEWLGIEVTALRVSSDIEFLKKFSALDQSQYLTAQNESLALLGWLKRYARAFQTNDQEG